MPNDKNASEPPPSFDLQPAIEEQFILSKTGFPEDCEDAIHVSSHFIAVIDGATSMSKKRWNDETSGKVAARILNDVFTQIPRHATVRQAADLMTAAIRAFYERWKILDIVAGDPVQRLTASIVAVNLCRKEVWFIGDCQCLLDQERVSNDKLVDRIVSEARALFLQAETLKGVTIEELRQTDTGRAFILPLLERQRMFQNNPATGEYWYPVVDGFPIPDDGLVVRSIPDHIKSIVLATDGYPILKDSLAESEQALCEILLDDPLLYRRYKATKGVQKGYASFDDRAYVKFKIK